MDDHVWSPTALSHGIHPTCCTRLRSAATTGSRLSLRKILNGKLPRERRLRAVELARPTDVSGRSSPCHRWTSNGRRPYFSKSILCRYIWFGSWSNSSCGAAFMYPWSHQMKRAGHVLGQHFACL